MACLGTASDDGGTGAALPVEGTVRSGLLSDAVDISLIRPGCTDEVDGGAVCWTLFGGCAHVVEVLCCERARC